jgi:L-glyceraldehyde 3-phosphate reductase
MVRQGKALYIGISNYKSEDAAKAIAILKQLGTPCLIHQPRYSMLDRWVEEDGLLKLLNENGIGCIAFSPLAQGLLTDKYLKGIPSDSRVGRNLPNGALTQERLNETVLQKVNALNELALQRNQTLAQMALAWVLKDERITSVLIGASSANQLLNSVASIQNLHFSNDELQVIEKILNNN